MGLSIVAYEKDYYNLKDDVPNSDPNAIMVSILMWIAFAVNGLLFISIILRH